MMSEQNAPSRGDRLHVVSAIAAMHGDPRISSAWISQLVAGQIVEVIECRSDWLRVVAEDGYEGWMHRGYLAPSTGDESSWRVSLGCEVEDSNGRRRNLPLLARLSPDAQIVQGEWAEASNIRQQFPTSVDAVCRSAQSLFAGASYVWGGVSPWGCDCSGFTQSIFSLHGIRLPRDASQQASALGTLDTATSFSQLPAGYLAFFSDREDRSITHVGIMLGDSRMAHSGLSRGGFAIETVSDSADAYVAKLNQNYLGGATALR